MKTTDLPTLPFATKKKWADWLSRQHDKSAGVWLKLAKKDSGIPSVTYDEAVEAALCYGWIDGQKKGFDEQYWLQKFTPRGPKSIWSKINTVKAEKLIASGEMKLSGLKTIEAAKQDGRWDAAYESQKNISIPEDFQVALDKNKKAKAGSFASFTLQILTCRNRFPSPINKVFGSDKPAPKKNPKLT